MLFGNRTTPMNPILYWSVTELLFFETGEIYGAILFKGQEADCDTFAKDHIENHKKQGLRRSIYLPTYFIEKKLVCWSINVIATNSECTIRSVTY